MTDRSDNCPPPSWTFYAFGGGMGHFTRALSLARYAARRGIPSRILSNSSFFPALCSQLVTRLIPIDPLIELIAFAETLERDQLIEKLSQELERCRREDILLVDTFPRGLGGELVTGLKKIPSFKVFIHRDISPEYVQRVNLSSSLSEFDRVIVPGEDAPLEHLAHLRTAPWLICDCDELLYRDEARQAMGVSEFRDLPLLVVSGSGTPKESSEAACLAVDLNQRLDSLMNVRFVSLNDDALKRAGEIGLRIWPLLALHNGIDMLIGSGGYHTIHETRATGTPLLAIPQSRLYDRQRHRIGLNELIQNVDEIFAEAIRFAEEWPLEKKKTGPNYINGAAEAFDYIRSQTNHRP